MSDGGAPLDGLVETTIRSEVGDMCELKFSLAVLLVKVLDEPGLLCRVADGSPHAIARKEELVADVRAEETVGAGDEDLKEGDM